MNDLQNKKLSWIIIVFLVLKPIFLFSSGGLQICDIFLIFCILWRIIKTKGKLYIKDINTKSIFIFACLVVYQFIINAIWFSTDINPIFLLKSFFYIYNFFAFLFFLHIASSVSIDKFKTSIAYGAFLSSIMALCGIILNHGSAVRDVGFFNNPNQLGFHGILILTLLFFTKDYLPKLFGWITFSCSIVLVLASASKAAFVGITFLSIIYILSFEKKITIQNIIIKMLLLTVVAILLYVFFFVQSPLKTDYNIIATMQYRLLNMMDNPTSNLATGRGYARIFEMGINFLWGMGEGDYGRFETLSHYEVHNLFINLFVSYGLIGFIGYMYIFGYAIVLWNNLRITFYNILSVSGIIIYSSTHNSIRNTIIFLILALLFLQKAKLNRKINEQ